MDTSKEYILMCKKSKEIQKLKPTKKRISFEYQKYTIWLESDSFFVYIKNKSIWLPRQDQLQDMVLDSYKDFGEMLNRFYHDTIDYCEQYGYAGIYNTKIYSMEQSWLDFVMEEKYKKIWDGNDWINSK